MSLLRPSYRARRRWRAFFLLLGSLALVLFVVWLCWLLWVSRFVVYTRDAARLDFDWTTPGTFAEAGLPPEQETVDILFEEPTQPPETLPPTTLQRLTGVQVSISMLTEEFEETARLLQALPAGTTVLLELKSGGGSFYYDSQVEDAPVSSKADTGAVADLLNTLDGNDCYVAVALPAFRDRAYGLEHTSQGIHHSSGGYLWADDDHCYWLDPARDAVIERLTALGMELQNMGVDEVVFTDFDFPPTEDILYEGDQEAALNGAASKLAQALYSEEFCVSFLCNRADFRLPLGRTRLYRSDVDAASAQQTALGLNISSMEVNLVYLTETDDPAFAPYSHLIPLSAEPTEPTAPTETTAPPENGQPSP